MMHVKPNDILNCFLQGKRVWWAHKDFSITGSKLLFQSSTSIQELDFTVPSEKQISLFLKILSVVLLALSINKLLKNVLFSPVVLHASYCIYIISPTVNMEFTDFFSFSNFYNSTWVLKFTGTISQQSWRGTQKTLIFKTQESTKYSSNYALQQLGFIPCYEF